MGHPPVLSSRSERRFYLTNFSQPEKTARSDVIIVRIHCREACGASRCQRSAEPRSGRFCSPLAFGQTANPVSGFYLLNKDGEGEEDGGGAEYVVNSLVGPNAEALPPRVAAAAHSAARPPTTVLDPP